MSTAPITTLFDLAKQYTAQRGNSPDSASQFMYAIRAFGKHIGHTPTTADFTIEIIDGWIDAGETRHLRSTIYGQTIRMITLWRFANKLGIVATVPAGRKRRSRTKPTSYVRPAPNPVLTSENARPWRCSPSSPKISTSLSPNEKPPAPTPEMRLADYYVLFYERMRLGGRSPRTKLIYRHTLRLFDKWLSRPATLADLTDDDVTAFIAWITERLAARSANNCRDNLLAIWRYGARKRHIELWPDVQPLPEFKRLPVAWTLEQFSKLLDATKDAKKKCHRKSLCGVPFDVFWRALLLVLYDTGARIGTTMQLHVADFDPIGKRLHFRAETQKTRCDQRLPVSAETAEAIADCIKAAPDREVLFAWPYAPCSIYLKLKKLLKAAGLPTGRRDKFHKIRRTSATFAEKFLGPGAATIHLGHSSPKVTEKYLDRTMLPEANVAASLPRPIMQERKDGAA